MSTLALLGIGAGSIALLLLLIIRWQVHAFVAMMLVSFLVAFATGMPIGDIISTLIAGMGGTLGSVAILVALGSMLGRMIEVSGGAASLANRFTQLLGPTRVPMALTAAALVLAIPVFFDVGFIILVPIVYGFCKAAGVNPIKFGLPVAGIKLGVPAVVPPQPGIVGGGAAWRVGPWLIRVLFGAEFELPGAVLAALTAASVGTAALMVTGNAALAFDRHLLYNAGWWVAVAAAAILLVTVPGPLDVRSAIALLAGPGVGVALHLVGLATARAADPAT